MIYEHQIDKFYSYFWVSVSLPLHRPEVSLTDPSFRTYSITYTGPSYIWLDSIEGRFPKFIELRQPSSLRLPTNKRTSTTAPEKCCWIAFARDLFYEANLWMYLVLSSVGMHGKIWVNLWRWKLVCILEQVQCRRRQAQRDVVLSEWIFRWTTNNRRPILTHPYDDRMKSSLQRSAEYLKFPIQNFSSNIISWVECTYEWIPSIEMFPAFFIAKGLKFQLYYSLIQ